MNKTISAGAIRYETELGPLFLDSLLLNEEINLIVNAMRRRLLEPNDILSASINSGIVDFKLREPLSSD